MKIKYRLENWDGTALLFQILEMDKSFIGNGFVSKNGFEIISHNLIAPTLGGKKAYVRNANKDHDYNICILYFKDDKARVNYRKLLEDSLAECFK